LYKSNEWIKLGSKRSLTSVTDKKPIMKERQFNHTLSTKQAAEGIKLAILNSQSLLSDAILLFENERYPRSVSLSILAIEEAGKPSIIRSIILEEQGKGLKKEWQRYRSHTSKNVAWILPELASKGAKRANEIKQIFDNQSDHARKLDNIKQLAFYTDVFSKCKWSIPEEVIDKDLAAGLISVAKILVGKDSLHSMSTEEALNLWVQHMKPVWKSDGKRMGEALLKCYREAEALGFVEKGMLKEMTDFLS